MMYEETIKLLALLEQYIQQALTSKTYLDIIVDYWIPIIGAIILVLSSLAAVTKYYIEKNRNLNEKILKEVYAPLFQYIVQQEYVRHSLNSVPALTVTDYPIISVSRKITGKASQSQTESVLQENDLLAVKKSINFGLAPQNLLVLLNVYEIAMNGLCGNTDEELKKIETLLRNEIIEGYFKYNRSLGLDKSKHILSYNKDSHIAFNFDKK